MPDEIVDVVDQYDKIIGTEKRAVVHQTGLWHRGVHIFVFNSDNTLIVQLRGKDQDTYPNTLDCSVSEHLRSKETYLDGAIRGLREELGLIISANHLLPLVRFKLRYGIMDNMISEFYEVKLSKTINLRISPETKQIYYYTIPELTKMAFENPSLFSCWFVQLLNFYSGASSNMIILENYSMPSIERDA